MKSKKIDSEYCFSLAAEQTHPRTPDVMVDAIAAQIERQMEAKRRIDEEGIVVRDMKGSVIEHPALKIERDAAKLLSELLKKIRKEPTINPQLAPVLAGVIRS